ncbi:MAG: MFS transporter [Candidatus Thorarchaeota archaeon]|nr:MFS transporter [Candidatus Thorarchaeota archaeon]
MKPLEDLSWNGSTHFNQFGDKELVKVIQNSNERSKNDLDDESSRIEWDLLARQEEIESKSRESKRIEEIKEEKEKLRRIRERIDNIEERIDEVKNENPSLVDSLRAIFSWRNYSVYLATSWVFAAFNYMGVFLTVYLRAELNWEYVLIGAVLSFVAAVSAISRLIGGYVGDVSNRKNLSVIAMFMMAAYNLIIGVAVEFTWILIALLFFSTMDVFKGGSTAFIMDNIPKRHSGLGISLFSAGRVFGIITLGVFIILTPTLGFGPALRLMFFSGGLFLVFSAILRGILLKGSKPDTKREGASLFTSFIQENRRALSLLLKAVPGMIAIVVLDSLSDSLFRFGSYLYIYEDVQIPIPGLTLMTIVTIIVSVPLLLGTGRFSDRRGERRTAILIYSLMPLCALLLLISPIFPYWVPEFVRNQADSAFNGLGAIFSTPFVALVLKSVNDSVWNLLLLTIIQKNLPRRDTAKILSMFWFIVFLIASIGPFIGGFVFKYSPPDLFVIIFLLNIIILGWIATRGLVKSAEKS